jgi:two-component system, NarL family, capsular synthesis sensor histidine kinase RcsC
MFSLSSHKKGLSLYCYIAPELSRMYNGDEMRVRQIIVNLVSNAVKFTEKGHVKIGVFSESSVLGRSELVICVEDTGIGIPARLRDELFEPFRQADSSITRRFGGTGLGLTLCKRLTGLMGGAISVSSEPEIGSVFRVKLPLRVDPRGNANSWHCANGSRIGLSSSAPEWHSAIMPHLSTWGLSVVPVRTASDLADGPIPLLIFSDQMPSNFIGDAAAMQLTPCVIWASGYGPRNPVQMRNHISVSCYSIDGIRRAVAGAILGDPTHYAGSSPNCEVLTGRDASVRRTRVLIAEDNLANRTLISDQLKILGYQADLVENGLKALEHFSHRQYDVVLTDLSMPELNGYELAACLRERGISVPIVAITAHTTSSEIERCAKAGISDIMHKPFSLDDMRRMLRKHTHDKEPGKFAPILNGKTARSPRSLPKSFYDALKTASTSSLSKIHHALEKRNSSLIQEELHSIKGGFLMARRHDIAELCAEMEESIRKEDFVAIANELPRLEHIVSEALQSYPKSNS